MQVSPLRLAVFLMLAGPLCLPAQTTTSVVPSKEEADQSTAIKAAELGGTTNVHQRNDLFFAGQFGQDEIAALTAKNISRVVTLRTDGEVKWDEAAALEAAKIEFVKVPFRSPETLTDEVFDRTRKLFKDKTQTTLFHCGSASRVGCVWLPYRVLDEGASIETALAEAKLIGLKTLSIQEKALDYIRRKQSTTISGEASVKPGINKKFIDQNLDVDAYVKRFEIESREVFLARERILVACEIEKGDTVADVGAGTGLFTRMFATAVGDQGWVFAADIAPRFIEHINRESTKHKINNITGILCAENSVNLPPKSVDVIFVCDTYHHFEYPKSTLASLHRALKDDGHLIVVDFERIAGKSREWLMGHVRAGKEVFQAEIQASGFALTEEKKIAGFQENYFLKFLKQTSVNSTEPLN